MQIAKIKLKRFNANFYEQLSINSDKKILQQSVIKFNMKYKYIRKQLRSAEKLQQRSIKNFKIKSKIDQ